MALEENAGDCCVQTTLVAASPEVGTLGQGLPGGSLAKGGGPGGVGQCHMLRWRLVVSEEMQSQGEDFRSLGQTPGLVALHRADPRGRADRSRKAQREAQQFPPRRMQMGP